MEQRTVHIICVGGKLSTFIVKVQFPVNQIEENRMAASGFFYVIFFIAEKIAAADHIYIIVAEQIRNVEIAHV